VVAARRDYQRTAPTRGAQARASAPGIARRESTVWGRAMALGRVVMVLSPVSVEYVLLLAPLCGG
jgi:hypothetical protein